MPVEVLSMGPQILMFQNVAYAMPACMVRVHSVVAVEISIDGTNWDALTGAETVGAEAASTFLRCPTSNNLIILKRA